MSATYRVETSCRICETRIPMGLSRPEVWALIEDRIRRQGERGETLLSVHEIDTQE